MNPNDPKPNFLDRGTIIAFALMFLVWFGWSKYMAQQAPPAVPTQQSEQQPGQQGGQQTANPVNPAQPKTGAPEAAANTALAAPTAGSPAEEKLIPYEDDNWAFQLSSHGMGLRDIKIKKYKTRTNEPIILGAVKGDYPFATAVIGSALPVDFQIERTSPDTFVGHATVGVLQIEKTMKLQPATYSIDTTVKVTGQMEGFQGVVTTMSEPYFVPEQQTGLFGSSSSTEHQDWFVRHDNTKVRKVVQTKDGVHISENNVTVAALSAHYFSLAVVDRSDLLPHFESNVVQGAPLVTGQLQYKPVSRPDVFNVHYVSFAGPKQLELLGQVDENLSQVVDYGIFGFLGKPILLLLKFLHSVFANWGWSIVVLTIIVRAIVMPFNAYSYKSMKAMQRVQPEMNRIKEKYKDKSADQKLIMNQEIMQLMKQNNASPLGGCLPTLLQLPVFFALYQVLGQSIELYRAPFIFWIHDLSVRDPFFVLPVLMGATMFAQQRLTPTAMDPQQAKILMWMPVIFSLFMISLPSGLTLYIFVSTLFAIIQQYFFMRDKSTIQGRVKEAKA
jgi:YidC/Oxa1 family membrane protein insertase